MDDAASITPIDGDHITNIVTWLCLIIAFFAVAVRFVMKWTVARKFGLDDALAIVAFFFAVLSGLAVTIEATKGLDVPFDSLSADDVKIQLLSAYVARLCFFATLCFANLSILAFIRDISPVDLHRRLTVGLSVFVLVVWIAESVTMALQCSPPRPWDIRGTCVNREAFWHFVGGMNIATDLSLVGVVFVVVKDLQMVNRKKAIVLGCFGARLIDVAATAVQLTYTMAFDTSNPYSNMWEFAMSTQIVQCITIVTSCIPYLRQLLDNLPSGMYLSDELRRRGISTKENTRSQGSSYVLKELDNVEGSEEKSSKRRSAASLPKVPGVGGIFTRIEISQQGSESAEHINATEADLSKTVTADSTIGCTRENSAGEVLWAETGESTVIE